MDIKLDTGETITNVTSLKSHYDIKHGTRLFYELNTHHDGQFRRIGVFKEINNPMLFAINEENRLNDPEFINLHNFVIVQPIINYY